MTKRAREPYITKSIEHLLSRVIKTLFLVLFLYVTIKALIFFNYNKLMTLKFLCKQIPKIQKK
jgi:hypothetical protein